MPPFFRKTFFQALPHGITVAWPLIKAQGVVWMKRGGWIRTSDLRVMSPTSYLTAPPRNCSLDERS